MKCLGASDGAYTKLNVPQVDKARYQTEKGDIATHALRVCSQDQ